MSKLWYQKKTKTNRVKIVDFKTFPTASDCVITLNPIKFQCEFNHFTIHIIIEHRIFIWIAVSSSISILFYFLCWVVGGFLRNQIWSKRRELNLKHYTHKIVAPNKNNLPLCPKTVCCVGKQFQFISKRWVLMQISAHFNHSVDELSRALNECRMSDCECSNIVMNLFS